MQDLDTVVAALEDIALLLSLSGQDGFKARAYRRGAELVLARGDELGTLVAQAALSEVEGIGPSLSKQITELWNTGRSSLLRRLEPGGVTPHGATNGQMRVIALTRKGGTLP